MPASAASDERARRCRARPPASTGRSPVRSASTPHGSRPTVMPSGHRGEDEADLAERQGEGVAELRAERRHALPQRAGDHRAEAPDGEDDPAVARAVGVAHARDLAPAGAVAARLGGVPARLHRAPAAPAGGRAVVEARAARVGRADADARALGRGAEHLRGVEREHAERPARRVGGGALAEHRHAVLEPQLRPVAGVHEPVVDERHRARAAGRVALERRRARTRRSPRAARAPRRARSWGRASAGRSARRAGATGARSSGRDERLDAAAASAPAAC